MKNIKTFVLFISIFLIYLGCTKPLQCGEALDLQRSAILIYPFDNAADNYLYTDNHFTTIYKTDSLKVINQDGNQPFTTTFLLKDDPRNPLIGIYAIKIAPAFLIPADNDAFNIEKARMIYLKYNYNTTDTLTLIFKATTNKCKKSTYEYAKVYYRGNLLTEVRDGIYLTINLKR